MGCPAQKGPDPVAYARTLPFQGRDEKVTSSLALVRYFRSSRRAPLPHAPHPARPRCASCACAHTHRRAGSPARRRRRRDLDRAVDQLLGDLRRRHLDHRDLGAMIKVVAPNVAQKVIDRAIQFCGGGGSRRIFTWPTRMPGRARSGSPMDRTKYRGGARRMRGEGWQCGWTGLVSRTRRRLHCLHDALRSGTLAEIGAS